MSTYNWTPFFLLLVWAGLGWSTSTAGTLPDELELVYEVRFGITELGSLNSKLTKQGDYYEVVADTRAQGLASLLLGGTVREMCKFQIDGDAVTPEHYRVVREGRDAFDRAVSFNWEERRVSFSSGTNVVIADGYIVDNCSVTFALIAGGAPILKQRSLHIVDGRKVRRFENIAIVQEEEPVSTPLGKFEAIRIEQVRFDRPDRKLTIWLATNRNNLPIKFLEQRKSRPDTTMLLKSVDGL